MYQVGWNNVGYTKSRTARHLAQWNQELGGKEERAGGVAATAARAIAEHARPSGCPQRPPRPCCVRTHVTSTPIPQWIL